MNVNATSCQDPAPVIEFTGYSPAGWQGAAQHTYTRACAGHHGPGPCPRPDWLAALDGLCLPCSDAEFYGLRMQHANCEHGDCACTYVIPERWPAGTWPVPLREPAAA